MLATAAQRDATQAQRDILVAGATDEQIAELDLYLSDKLVDMSRPVTVVAGDKVLYRGRASGKLTVKLRDGEKYDRGEGDTLWRDILEIRKAAR